MAPSVGRFSPNAFKYNERFGLVLIPSLIILAGYAGKAMAAILLAGAMFTYIMDALSFKEASLASVWVTLISANFGFLISNFFKANRSILMMIGSAGLNGFTLMLVGIWATLQYKWMRIRDPQLMLIAERCLFASSLPVGMVVLSLGVSTAVGISLTPFVAMVVGCLLYMLFMRPALSSFQLSPSRPGIGGSSSLRQIQGKYEGATSALAVCLFPSILYLSSHWEVAFELEHFSSIHLLWSVPAVFLCFLPNGLWWISEELIRHEYSRAVISVLCGIVALASFEGRVIFHSFGAYIPLHTPWNWIIVSVFLFSKAIVVGAHFSGVLATQIGFTVGATLLICSACAGGVAAGLPLALMPAPLIGSAGLALFYDSGMLRDYLVFVAGTAATFFWLLWHHFWFLEIIVGSLSLQTVCQLIAISFVVAITLPGLHFSDMTDHLIKYGIQCLLLVQSCALVTLEEHLYGGEHDEDAVIYPAYLVVATSIIGIYFSKVLEQKEVISTLVSWLLQCAYIAKLPILLLPQAQLVPLSFCLALAISPPLLLMKHKVGHTEEISGWKGTLLAVTVILAVLLSRMTIFDVVQTLFASQPSEGFLLGILFLAIAAGCLPLIIRFYSNSSAARRSFVLCTAFGILLCTLRPPVPIVGMAKCPKLPAGLCPRLWDERHVPHHEVDDVEIYGLGLSRREHWPLWLLISAVMTGLAAITTETPNQKPVQTRLFWGVLGGFCVGSYLATEFFPNQGPLQFLILLSALLCCGFLVFLQRESGPDSSWMILFGTLWCVLLPLSILFQMELPLPAIPEDMKRLFPDNPRLVEHNRERAGTASILAIYACQSLLLSFALKLKVTRALSSNQGALPGRSGGHWSPRHQGFVKNPPYTIPSMSTACTPGGVMSLFSSMVSPQTLDKWARMMQMNDAGTRMIQVLNSQGLGWVPTAGNITTFLCFALSLCWSSYFAESSELVLFLAAPILLLLNQDPLFCKELVDKRRYFPVIVSLVLCLTWNATSQIALDGILYSQSVAVVEPPLVFVVWNLLALIVTLPSSFILLHYLWTQKQLQHQSYAFLLVPLNLIPFFRSTIFSTRLLGIIGSIGCILVSILTSHIIRTGQNRI